MDKKLIKKLLNPAQIVWMNICDPEPSQVYKIIKVDVRPWYVKLFQPNSEPKYEHKIEMTVVRHRYIMSFDEFFKDKDNEYKYLYPDIEDGVSRDETLMMKPCVKIWGSDGSTLTKVFENCMDRDSWLAETGLDKVAETFIQTNIS